jgi:hypothetical protein
MGIRPDNRDYRTFMRVSLYSNQRGVKKDQKVKGVIIVIKDCLSIKRSLEVTQNIDLYLWSTLASLKASLILFRPLAPVSSGFLNCQYFPLTP